MFKCLYTSIKSPVACLNFNFGMLSFLRQSSYEHRLKPLTSLVARRWTDSIKLMCLHNFGDQTACLYSRCGLTNDMYNVWNISGDSYRKLLFIRPTIESAFLTLLTVLQNSEYCRISLQDLFRYLHYPGFSRRLYRNVRAWCLKAFQLGEHDISLDGTLKAIPLTVDSFGWYQFEAAVHPASS